MLWISSLAQQLQVLCYQGPDTSISWKRFERTSAEISALSFNVLNRNCSQQLFFLSILKSYFIRSIYSIAWNETKYPIFDMLGWNLFLLIHFSTEPKISSETWFIIYGFSFISMFEAVFLKKVFGSSGSYFSNLVFFQLVLSLFQGFLYSRKKCFIFFQKSLLSFKKEEF